MNVQKELLIVKNLTKKFKNGAGVENASFSLKPGQITGFLGDNGAGKTTTIKLIFGEYQKNSGEITINGIDHHKKEALQKIVFFPDQNSYPKYYKIKKYAYYCAALKNISKKYVDSVFPGLLEALELTNFANSRFSELSAGMQKRALLLGVLLTDSDLIILDEPTANLDVESRIEFLEVLKFLVEKRKKTVMITSHNIDELNTFINNVIFIKEGKIVYENSFDSSKENLRDLYAKNVDSINKKLIKSSKIEQILSEREGLT